MRRSLLAAALALTAVPALTLAAAGPSAVPSADRQVAAPGAPPAQVTNRARVAVPTSITDIRLVIPSFTAHGTASAGQLGTGSGDASTSANAASVLVLSMTHQPQQTRYYCGPASVSMALGMIMHG